jgi:hypothetical protein
MEIYDHIQRDRLPDFIHRPDFNRLNTQYTSFRRLDLSPPSCKKKMRKIEEKRGKKLILLGPQWLRLAFSNGPNRIGGFSPHFSPSISLIQQPLSEPFRTYMTIMFLNYLWKEPCITSSKNLWQFFFLVSCLFSCHLTVSQYQLSWTNFVACMKSYTSKTINIDNITKTWPESARETIPTAACRRS